MINKIAVLLLIFNINYSICKKSDNIIHINAREFEMKFYEDFKNFTDNGEKSIDLQNMIKLLNDENCKDIIEITDIPTSTNAQSCLKCRALINTIIQFKKINKTTSFLKEQSLNLCNEVTTTAAPVCKGMIELNTPVIEYILNENTNILSEHVCGILYQADGCSTELKSFIEFEINNNNVQKVNKQPEHRSSLPPLTVVHITDVHYDPYYNPGGNAVCGEGACCRLNQGKPKDADSAAGQWGDYRDCDSPWEAVVDILQNIKKQYKHIDYIYFTGDIIDHFSWEATKEGNLESMKKFFKLLRDEFQGIPVYPIIGNHESHPGNLYSPTNVKNSDISSQWIYDYLVEEWSHWLPGSTNSTVRSGGYYTVLVRPGFRIIAVNSNVCYVHNWWLCHNSTLFAPQLKWLHDVLHTAALNNEFVHIIGHVPVNDPMCYVGWTHEYRKIIEKFSYMITAQFNGHSHVDEFVVFYDSKNSSNAINVAWNGASGTTFTYLNPNYRVYKVHPLTYDVLDFDTWIYNLTEANTNPTQSPRWFKEYSFKDAYDLQDLSLKSLDGLLQKFSNDKSLITKYWEYKIKLADPQLEAGCNAKCLLGHLCDIVRVQYNDKTKCNEFSNINFT